jgi:plasmid stabilization system protein ParE
MAKGKPLAIRFSSAASTELHAIWAWNAHRYGVSRANTYLQFVLSEIEKLAETPTLGRDVAEYEGLLRFLIKKRSRGHGHIVFFRVIEDRLEVAHVYHTAQDWSRILEGG